MNRTIEQWQKVADAECKFHSVLNEAISDLQELARQLETERAAWSAKRAELLRNHAAELVRRKAAEAQRDELVVALEEIASIPLHPLAHRAGRIAAKAIYDLKEQTK